MVVMTGGLLAPVVAGGAGMPLSPTVPRTAPCTERSGLDVSRSGAGGRGPDSYLSCGRRRSQADGWSWMSVRLPCSPASGWT